MINQILFNICVTKIISANRLINSPVGITTHRKNREQWAFVLKKGGKTIYNINGKEILSDSNHPVILPKGCTYSWKCLQPGDCLIIEFDTTEQFDKFFSFTVSDNSQLINLFSKIERKLILNQNSCKVECKSILYQIIAILIKSLDTEYTPTSKQKILEPAIKYITNNYYDSEITNDFLANLCGVSTVYFRKVFYGIYGVSPIKFLQNLRIEKAKAILQSDYDSISQVAESVGFNSIYHFSKTFKQVTTLSPLQFAKKY